MKTLINESLKRYLKSIPVLLTFLFIFNAKQALAITITSPGPPTCVITGVVGTPITPYTILTDVPGTTWTVEGLDCAPDLASIGLSLDPNSGIISGTPTVSVTCSLYVSVVDAADPTQYDDGYLLICISRPPVDIMLCLDRSGSMSQSVSGLSMTKWEILKETVETFLQQLDYYGESGDQVGVVYFDHTRLDYPDGGIPGLHAFVDETAIVSDMNLSSRDPYGWTCIGGGILAAEQELASNPYSHIFLLSDGIQNRDPSFNETTGIISDQGIYTDWTGTPATGTLNLNTQSDFKIHTIAIGDDAVTTLMDGIADANDDITLRGGKLLINSTSSLIADLDAFFDVNFMEALSDFSPAIVGKKILTTPVSGSSLVSTHFFVNNTADKIIIKAIGDPRQIKGLEMNVKKGAMSFSNYIKYDYYRKMFFIDKALADSLGVTLGGRWDVEFNGRNGVEFYVTCIVNDESINYNTTMGTGDEEPGDPLNLDLSIDIFGEPVKNLTQAQVIVLKPGQDLNDLFSNANSDIDPPAGWTSEEGVNPGQALYEKLIALDTSFINALIPQEHIHNLTNNGDGTYSFSFTNTEESGVYRAVFYLKGSTPEQGTFERYYLMTTVIDFGQPDENNTVFEIQDVGGAPTYMITPMNSLGHLIGPNRLNQVVLLVDNKRVVLTDNLNGSYQAKVSNGFFKPDPKVQLNIKSADFTQIAGITNFSDIKGSNVTTFDKIKPWLIFILLIIIIIIGLYRRLSGSST